METERLIAGRYRLRHVLGRGSMGTVWAAHDEVLRRDVAVKEVLVPPGMPDVEADLLRERTLREARSVAQLTHPNVVTLYDVAQVDGDPYVVMELVPSASLADLVRQRGPLTAEQGAVVADAVAAALEAAHRAGITHRDVKPGNVLVADDGRVKLTDFGIARNVAEATLTGRGIALGTPAFIAPEVAAGGAVSPAADQWSLGATLFAALTGQQPYEGTNLMQTINQVVHGEAPSAAVCGALEPVVAGLMAKDPTSRMSLADVRRAVRPLLPEPGTDVFPSDAGTRPVVPIVRPRPPVAKTPVAKTPVPPDTPLAADPGPLPFRSDARTRDVPRRTSPTALVAVGALVLFAIGGGAGFALTRTLAGAPLLPPPAVSAPPLPGIADEVPLRVTTASAATANGEQGAEFTIEVGADWTSFLEQRVNKGLMPSTVVHLVEPTGVYEVTVQRFADYYPRGSVDDYLDLVRSRWPKDQYFGEATDVTDPLDPSAAEPPVQFSYRTVEKATSLGRPSDSAGPDLRRSRYSRVLPRGADLWVVEVVFPTEQEEMGRNKLFNTIANTFTVVG
ncbi:serine/threonine protein kinase [Saccharothrix tamanrassetensis]|uniref:non-specific serine/threonine protein kinase n=1 Tax=Saccharothrix tamanrassetensis TaxID=1051531 RepID=A0A841CGC9_9PSEU|nr:serine/threonine-protein kinase [Saccharothrix tamanrassetensis]MBB5955075.1 serine/threonine protein kinase [Saccharothrix tamanrassetensis]